MSETTRNRETYAARAVECTALAAAAALDAPERAPEDVKLAAEAVMPTSVQAGGVPDNTVLSTRHGQAGPIVATIGDLRTLAKWALGTSQT